MHEEGTWTRVDDVEVKTPVETTAIKVDEKAYPEAFTKSSSSYQCESGSLIAHIMSGECSASGRTWISPRQSSLRKRLSPLLQIWLQSPYQDASGRVRL